MSISDDEERIWAQFARAAERGDLKPTGNSLGRAELEAIRDRIRAEHGHDDFDAYLRAVFERGGE